MRLTNHNTLRIFFSGFFFSFFLGLFLLSTLISSVLHGSAWQTRDQYLISYIVENLQYPEAMSRFAKYPLKGPTAKCRMSPLAVCYKSRWRMCLEAVQTLASPAGSSLSL